MMTTQNNGFELIEFLRVSEAEMYYYQPLAGSYAIIQAEGCYLLGYNSLRQQWECPAGKREDGENPLECAKRELFEETGQSVDNLDFIGLARVRNQNSGAEKFNPIFYSTMNLLAPFKNNPEMSKIKLWDFTEVIHIDEVDLAILREIKNNQEKI